ncbi:hypothetical protein BJ742DRAFT_55770 [Cladochytrium replicatum]|nr:hypothetical protein BJ742DRAFT_55770 [Cladochytrium replicatum]
MSKNSHPPQTASAKPSITRKSTMAATVAEASQLGLVRTDQSPRQAQTNAVESMKANSATQKRKVGFKAAEPELEEEESETMELDSIHQVDEPDGDDADGVTEEEADGNDEPVKDGKAKLKKRGTMAATVAEAEALGLVADDSETGRSAASKAKQSIRDASASKRKTPTKPTLKKNSAPKNGNAEEEAAEEEPDHAEEPAEANEEEEEEKTPTTPKLKKKGTMAATVAEAEALGMGSVSGGRSAASKAKLGMGSVSGGRSAASKAKQSIKEASASKRKTPTKQSIPSTPTKAVKAVEKDEDSEGEPEENDQSELVADAEEDGNSEEEEAPAPKKAALKKKGTMAATVAEAQSLGLVTDSSERSAASKAKQSIKDSTATNRKQKSDKTAEKLETDAAPSSSITAKLKKVGTMAATVAEAKNLGLTAEGSRSAATKARAAITEDLQGNKRKRAEDDGDSSASGKKAKAGEKKSVSLPSSPTKADPSKKRTRSASDTEEEPKTYSPRPKMKRIGTMARAAAEGESMLLADDSFVPGKRRGQPQSKEQKQLVKEAKTIAGTAAVKSSPGRVTRSSK